MPCAAARRGVGCWSIAVDILIIVIGGGVLLAVFFCLYTFFGWAPILACWVTGGEGSFGRQSCSVSDTALTVYMWEATLFAVVVLIFLLIFRWYPILYVQGQLLTLYLRMTGVR